MTQSQDSELPCPYCGQPLHWVPLRWFGRGTFECDQCGDFPDLTHPVIDRTAAARTDAPIVTVPRRHDGRPRVLLVDDSQEHRDLYALMLEPTATVITASRGEDAVTIASSQPLDAIVLDVMMPGMDGWQACERIKSNPLTSRIPVIMLTSLDGLDTPAHAERVGAAAVLMKPCPVERLAIAIKEAVQRRFGGARRWTRKPVAEALPVRIDDLPAKMLNVSYGGFCAEVERLPSALPTSFNVIVPASLISIHADTVWTSCGAEEHWMCGAEILEATDAWRTLVDGV